LKNPRDKLQEYVMKNRGFHLRNLRWLSRDLDNAIQDRTNITLYNVLLETLQLLSEIFLSAVLGFRDIWLARVV